MTEVGSSHKTTSRAANCSSRVFCRNRAIGYVSNHVAAVLRYVQRRKDTLITTCIGRSFQVYNASHFRLIHVSDIHPDEITAMAVDRYHMYTASNKCIYAWRAGKIIKHIFRGHQRDVHLLLPFSTHLIAVDQANVLIVWLIAKAKMHLELPFNKEEFTITALAHPPTYINKIVLGSEQGLLKIWNIKENRLIYTFTDLSKSKVTALEAAPALDVLAVGHQNGCIELLNLKFDEILMQFKQDWGAVTNLTFRTDGPAIMISGSTNGHLAFWNLEQKKIENQLQAHDDIVSSVICFSNEPIIFTASPDNSMKLWIFDMPGGGARLLRIREGHTQPPLCIRFHGSQGVSILSAGQDSSLRVFSTISESLHKSMGKASYNRKASKKKNRFQFDPLIMPPIVEFTAETTREKEWDNIAAIHAGIIQSTTWTFDKNRMGQHRLVPTKFQNKERSDFKTETTCLTLTHCGNFVIIGYSNGDLMRFNIQSGIFRAQYGNPAHASAVRGICSDNLNQFVLSGCSQGLLKFWPFKDQFKEQISKPLHRMHFDDGISLMRSHRESAMVAIILETFVIYIVDADARNIIRKFEGHKASITDATFSPDSRWLISAAMDSTIKVWHIPSAYMIDHFRTERPCRSLTMSPTGNFLATAHVNFLGIYLWCNKTLFNHESLRAIDPFSEAPYVALPANAVDELSIEDAMSDMSMQNNDDAETIDNAELGIEINAKYVSPAQLSSKLISMSGEPISRWQNLLDLELIKKRNKPKALLKKPKQAPFFLPTVAGLEMKFDLPNSNSVEVDSKMRRANLLSNLTRFGKLLEEAANTADYEKCFAHLKQFGPSMIDFEIKSLHPLGGGTCLAMLQFLKMIEWMFTTNANFELAQSYLSVFLRAHCMDLLEFPEIMQEMPNVLKLQQSSWQRIEQKLIFNMGVVSALRNYVQ